MTKQADNSVNQTQIELQQAYKLTYKAIKSYKKAISKADIQLKTGLSLFNTEDALNLLMENYACELTVNELGQIIYHFDLTKKRNTTSFKDKLINSLNFVAKIILFILKLIITLAFFSYSLTVGLVIAIILVGLTKSLQPVFLIFVGVFTGIKMLFTDTKSFFSDEIRDENKKNENLILMVFAYAFGNKKATDKLEQDKKIIDYISKQDNKITVADLMLITGWNVKKSNQELSYMLTHYRGKIRVTDNGILIYEFPEFSDKTLNNEKKIEDFYIWNNPLPPLPYNYNDKTTNKIINSVAWGSLILSIIIAVAYANEYSISLFSPSNLFEILNFNTANLSLYINQSEGLWLTTLIYFIFFFAFLIFSAKRAQKRTQKQNNKRAIENQKAKRLQTIFKNLPFVHPDFLNDLDEKQQSYYVYDTGGNYKVNETNGELFIDYSWIKEDLETVNKQRKEAVLFDFTLSKKAEKIIKDMLYEAHTSKYKSKKKRKRQIILISIASIISIFIYFFNTIFPVIQTQIIQNGYSITINYESKLIAYIDQSKLNNFRYLILLNPSKKHPIKWPKKLNYIKKIRIINAKNDFTLPTFTNLDDLSMESCHLTKIPNAVFSYKSLYQLNLNNNQLHIIPKELLKLPKLSMLYLRKNKIETIPKFLYRLKNIYEVDLSHNKIKEINDSAAYFIRGGDWNLSHNRITQLPDNIWRSHIYKLNLSYNLLQQIPEIKTDTAKIKVLYLNGNKINKLPNDFYLMKELKKLDLSDNQLSSLPKKFNKLKELRNINLSNNLFTAIPEELPLCKELKTMNLTGNKLSTIPMEMENCRRKYPQCKVIVNKNLNKEVKKELEKYVSEKLLYYK